MRNIKLIIIAILCVIPVVAFGVHIGLKADTTSTEQRNNGYSIHDGMFQSTKLIQLMICEPRAKALTDARTAYETYIGFIRPNDNAVLRCDTSCCMDINTNPKGNFIDNDADNRLAEARKTHNIGFYVVSDGYVIFYTNAVR